MKKITKIAATFAAAMAIFLGASCSHDGGASLATLGAGGGGGGGKTRATTGSWNFVSQADTVAWVASLKTNTITKADDGTLSLDKSGDISIKSDPLSDSTDGLTLTILKEKPWSGATAPNYSYKEAASGLRIKNPALKIADVKGKVKVTIEWACISGQSANNREIQLYKGDDEGGTIVDKAGNDATSGGSGNVDMTPFEKTVEAGDGMDLYIGGSNNIFIKTVKIEEADPSSPDEEIDDGDDDEEEDDEDEDEPEEDLSSIFTIENGCLNLKADNYEYSLSQTNLEATTGNNAWSAVSGSATWGEGKKSVAPFDTKITVLNMSNSGNRAITLKVKGVSAFRVYVQKETDASKNDRTYKVKINDSDEQTGHNNVDYEDFTTGTTGEATIFIGEASNSIYPVGVILYKTAPAE